MIKFVSRRLSPQASDADHSKVGNDGTKADKGAGPRVTPMLPAEMVGLGPIDENVRLITDIDDDEWLPDFEVDFDAVNSSEMNSSTLVHERSRRSWCKGRPCIHY